ncbi:MAG: aminotransferase class IV [Sedimentisphaerales bacterium]|nr:aminotransferase class IV [Sedimentisphaerales bacterium]
MSEKVFLNDKIIDNEKANLSVTDSGFLYGAGLFETMRSYNGKVFSLDDHLDRLFFSANALSIKIDNERKFISDSIYNLLDANSLTDARLRLTVSSGSMSLSQENKQATMLITATQLQPYPKEYYEKGVLVTLCPYRQNTNDPTCGHKTTSYFSRMLALQNAHQKGAAEALWFTTDNKLAEGCVSNVFLVKDSKVFTPPLYTPVLAGIARKTICKLAMSNTIELVEKDLNINDVIGADEIFLTNVIMQVMPVVQVEQHVVNKGIVGETTKLLIDKYNELVGNKPLNNE